MDDLTLPNETRVAIMGDWHLNTDWVDTILPALHEWAPDVRTVLHLGDFGFWHDAGLPGSFEDHVDRAAATHGIERILVTPGNHEHWNMLDDRFAERPGWPAKLSETVWALPRGYRFTIAGRSFLSFGGAASVNRHRLSEGHNWWPTEAPTRAHAAAAIADGPADVMLAHEAITHVGPRAAIQLTLNPTDWPADALAESASSRRTVTDVWEAVRPRVFAHGHMHLADENALPDGRRVYSVDRDGAPRNLALLDVDDLSWEWFDWYRL